MSRAEEEKKRHEYLLAEIRLVGEDIKEHIRDRVEPRIKSLEATRDFQHGIIKTVGIGVPSIGSVSWFVWQITKEIGNLKGWH